MEQRTKNTTMIIFGLMAVLSLFVIMPLLMPGGCTSKPTMPTLSDEVRKTYTDFITARPQDPAEFIASSFDAHDVVFLSNTLYHTTFEVTRRAVPALYRKGVRAIGVEFLLADDQADIDSLVTAEKYDETKARRLLAYFMLYYAYQDCLALFRDVWSLNGGRKRGEPPLRLLGLGMKINRDLFTSEAYRDRKDLQKASLNGMTQDDFMFSIIEREIIQKKAKALVYVSPSFCLKNALQKRPVEVYRDIGIEYRGTAAMLARARIGERAFVILFHNVWTLTAGGGTAFPVEGVLEAAMKALPEDKTVAAFLAAESPCRDVPVARDFIDVHDKPIPFKDVCDAYILVGPLYRYRTLPLPAGSLTKEDILPFLRMQGLKPEDVEKYTPADFITRANKDIEAANAEMANLPH